MKRTATVIIGSNFGDEGKGLMTDFFAGGANGDCIVARFNGGAQAGHTVVLANGTRHVHSHFASGTLSGAATYLNQDFVSNPLLFFKEHDELASKIAAPPNVYADERGLVTTPFDMLINQFAEQMRGTNKHGSCGIGFGETIERNQNERYRIQIKDLRDSARLARIVKIIRREWVKTRLQQLKISDLRAEQSELLISEQLSADFLETAARFADAITIAPATTLTKYQTIILEGAQGLLLDQNSNHFPHVTRSNTGIKNAVALANEAGINALNVMYATRAYMTRHGAGNLPHELAAKPYPNIIDSTNVPNPHQDSLRFGWLDINSLAATIRNDLQLNTNNQQIKITPQLAVTCLDQIDETAFFISNSKLCSSSKHKLTGIINQAIKFNHVFSSWGDTRQTIIEEKF